MKCLFLITLISYSCDQKSPEVEVVYPTADTLPENLLRMYVQFSEPMKTVDNLEKIKLLNKEGKEIKGAIFQNAYELWNENQTQLTLIFDPARVKTGLQANENLGRALQSGQFYELHINGLKNIKHQEMKAPFKKKFFVTEADDNSPDMSKWKVIPPKAKSKTPLILAFSEMVDQMSLHQRLVVTTNQEEVVIGEITIGNQETEWRFTPSESWEAGTYSILINARLADPSGNNLNGLFDHPIDSLKYQVEGEILILTFKINE